MIVAAASSTSFSNAVVRALLPIRRWKANLTFSGSLLSLARSLRSSVRSSSSENVSGSRGRRSGRVGDGIGDCFRVHSSGIDALEGIDVPAALTRSLAISAMATIVAAFC